MTKKEASVKPTEYVKGFIRVNGLPKAKRIAEGLMKSTQPDSYASLPAGYVFFPKDKRKPGISQRELEKNHNFWTEVFYLLRKMK